MEFTPISTLSNYSATFNLTIEDLPNPVKVELVGYLNSDVKDNIIPNSEISIYPNPSSDNFTITYPNTGTNNYSLIIYDIYGNAVKIIEGFQSFTSNNSVNWNCLDNQDIPVSNGVYQALLKSGNKMAFFTLVVFK